METGAAKDVKAGADIADSFVLINYKDANFTFYALNLVHIHSVLAVVFVEMSRI